MKNNETKNGFTLVETLVAIAILLLAVAAPLSLANKSLNSSALSKQQITASFLAQEAMEYIRNVRDENILKGKSWLHPDSGLNNCLNGNKCIVDPTAVSGTDKIKKCVSGICPVLRYNNTSGLYSHDTNVGPTDSIYTRWVEMKGIGNNEAAVLITVSWKGTNGVDYKVIARENLTNWQ